MIEVGDMTIIGTTTYRCIRIDSDDNVYRLPADLIAIENISILDTSDSRYKRIKRISSQPHYLLEDTSPWVVT